MLGELSLASQVVDGSLLVPKAILYQLKRSMRSIQREITSVPLDSQSESDLLVLGRLEGAIAEIKRVPISIRTLSDGEAIASIQLQKRYRQEIHEGEADVLALCASRGCTAIMDDRRAREVAIQMCIPVMGTLEILIRAVRRGIITTDVGEESLEQLHGRWAKAPAGSLHEYTEGKLEVWAP